MSEARGGILSVGIDDGHVKACLCDRVSGTWRLVNWLAEQIPPKEHTQGETATEGATIVSNLQWVLNTLGQFMGCDLQHALLPAPHALESDSAAYPLDRVLLTASPSPPLKVWIMTLTPLWLPQLEAAVHSQPAHVVGVTLLQGDLPAWRLRQELFSGQPDLLLVCGGYEGEPEPRQGRSSTVSLLTECLALYESPLQIVFAGQSAFASELLTPIRDAGRFDPIAIPNIAPYPEYFRFGPLQEALTALQGAREGQALDRDAAQAWGLEGIGLLSVSESFTRALRVWQGHRHPDAALHGVLASAHRRLHVLLPAAAHQPATIWHGGGEETPDQLQDWPPVGLASGLGPASFPRKETPVCEPKGFLPLMAPLFAMDPAAGWSILTEDLLVEP